jgi:4-hydroxy-tetrahydrodipicolinate reductase
MNAVRLAIAGAGGRMGQALIEAALAFPEVMLAAALDVEGSPSAGRDAGERFGHTTGVTIRHDIRSALRGVDVLIDFTRPEGTLAHAQACAAAGVGMVIGTTGLNDAQRAELSLRAQSVPIVCSANMSVGVVVLLSLVQEAAARLGPGYDVEIVEMHHRHKVDAPSGTALAMGETIAHALGRELKDCAVYGREGVTGERDPSTIGFAAIRGGDIVGDHTVLFAGIGERIEITHKSANRLSYAQGSLRAAHFLAGHERGFFDMQDVLGLR